LSDAAKKALKEADKLGGTIRLTAHPSLAAYLRDLLQDSTAPPPMRRPDSTLRYDVDRGPDVELCAALDLPEDEVPALR
jgi:hypothetical protein